MATREEIYAAIRNADKAGDTASVQKLGAYLQTMDQQPATEAKGAPKGTGSESLDKANAVSTGFNRGLLRVAGMPVDTVANVIDLGKAALGSGYSAVTGKTPPESLQLKPRAGVVGSGDYLVDKVGGNAAGDVLINPANPDYEGGYLQAAGAGLNAVVNPQSRAQAVNQAVLGVTSALGSKAAVDKTGNPALGVVAALAPGGIQQAVVGATKYAIRGDEKGRQAMAQRIQDLKNAGIDEPTMGLASANKLVGGVENLLQSTPGAVGVMSRARDKAVAGLQAKSDEAAALASGNRGTMEAGTAIQRGLNVDFKGQFKDKQGKLYDRLEREVGSQFPTSVDATKLTLADLNQDIQGAPAVSQFFKNGKIQALEGALRSDLAGAPESVQVYQQPPKAGGGLLNAPIPQEPLLVKIPAYPSRTTLPFEAVKKTRTMVGNEIADSNMLSDVPRSKWNPLYAALTEDMGNAARANGGPDSPAVRAFDRANNYTRAGMDRLDRVAPFGAAVAPEQAFTAMERAARENVSTLQAVKKTLPQDARGSVAGTIIERLGRATNGQQNADGTAWSPESFLTNWNKMTPKARQELFSGFENAAEVKASVDSVAQAASMMRDSSKMWANPSGSGANLAARGMLGLVGVGGGASLAGLVNPLVPAGVAGGMLGANGLARALTSKGAVESAARRSTVSPNQLAAQVLPLFSTGER